MSDTSNWRGHSFFQQRLIGKLWPWLVFCLVGVLVAQIVASPSYAWWFTPTQSATSVTPVHQQGLTITPLTQTLIPQFLLQPLSQTVTEEPPVAEAPIQAPVITPTPRPTLVMTKVEPPASQTVSADYSATAQRILQLVNQQRAAHGLVALRLNAALTRAAQSYAEYMSQAGFFSHTGLNGSKFTQRDEAAGYTGWNWLEENIAYGQTSPEMVMSDWMDSPEHRDNILNPHVRDLGVGMAGHSPIYWVQEFGVQ
jgi:uncharacterized protein YkwD